MLRVSVVWDLSLWVSLAMPSVMDRDSVVKALSFADLLAIPSVIASVSVVRDLATSLAPTIICCSTDSVILSVSVAKDLTLVLAANRVKPSVMVWVSVTVLRFAVLRRSSDSDMLSVSVDSERVTATACRTVRVRNSVITIPSRSAYSATCTTFSIISSVSVASSLYFSASLVFTSEIASVSVARVLTMPIRLARPSDIVSDSVARVFTIPLLMVVDSENVSKSVLARIFSDSLAMPSVIERSWLRARVLASTRAMDSLTARVSVVSAFDTLRALIQAGSEGSDMFRVSVASDLIFALRIVVDSLMLRVSVARLFMSPIRLVKASDI